MLALLVLPWDRLGGISRLGDGFLGGGGGGSGGGVGAPGVGGALPNTTPASAGGPAGGIIGRQGGLRSNLRGMVLLRLHMTSASPELFVAM